MKKRLVTLLMVSGVLVSAPLFGEEVDTGYLRIFSDSAASAYDSAMDMLFPTEAVEMPQEARNMRRDIRDKYEKAKSSLSNGMDMNSPSSINKKHPGAGGQMKAMQNARNDFISAWKKYRKAMKSGMRGNPLSNYLMGYFNADRSPDTRMDMHMQEMKRSHERFNKHYEKMMDRMRR